MIVTQEQILSTAKSIAPIYNFDPKLITALGLQECGRNEKGELDASISKMEPGFYRKYVQEKLTVASSIEADFSISWGVWQMMGLSLYERKYFQWYFDSIPSKEWKEKVLQLPMNPICITEAINYHNVNLNTMCEYACKHLATKRISASKMDSFKGEKDKKRMMLLLWNGGSDENYDDKVIAREIKL